MFLDTLRRRNPQLLEAAVELHQAGRIPANSYVLDLDAIEVNARSIADEADRLRLQVFAMTKQLGRCPPALAAMARGGIDTFVAVDTDCAGAIAAAGHRLGHVGHLVQVPQAETSSVAAMNPDHWTVFSVDKAKDAAAATARHERTQPLLARIHAPGDIFYPGHEGGFPAAEITSVAETLAELDHGEFTGITTFPALLFDQNAGQLKLTPNASTLETAAENLHRAGFTHVQVNAPGTTSTATLRLLADAGATQVEPGHGLTGTTPPHAVEDLPEIPAVLYLSEVSHLHAGRAYCFGGGLYIDPVFNPYAVHAIIARSGDDIPTAPVAATLPPPDAIDYYGILDSPRDRPARTGDTVIFGFRCQAFVTRAHVVPIAGVSLGQPEIHGVWPSAGPPTQSPPATSHDVNPRAGLAAPTQQPPSERHR